VSQSQILILGLLAATCALFLWARWRHDVVAVASLLAAVFCGLVPTGEAFAGFSHPAVISVACILILSKALEDSGAIDIAARRLLPGDRMGFTGTVAVLCVLVATLSAFMNNVGALALLMPVAMRMSMRQGEPVGRYLMPLAFASLLGGMTTLIGTPPNLIVSSYRTQDGNNGFGMFDFADVGVAVALTGILVLILGARFLVPARERAGADSFEIGAYLTETRVLPQSRLVGRTLADAEQALQAADAQILGLIRNRVRLMAPNMERTILADDILIIEAEILHLAPLLGGTGLALAEAKGGAPDAGATTGARAANPLDLSTLAELVVLPTSSCAGRSAAELHLRSVYGINLLAISRQGQRSTTRLRTTGFRAGDVLLLQGAPDRVAEFAAASGCVPLADRELRLPDPGRALRATAIMVGALAVAASGIVPPAVAFAAGALIAVIVRSLPVRQIYEAVDWPVIVMLGALIPVAGAMESTGAADAIAHWGINTFASEDPALALVLLLVITVTLTDFMNNAATAAVMCPIAIGIAGQYGVSADPFLMAVAIGASCSFLTPIGHQNNTLILGPGGFRFGDYWRLGLPLEVAVILVAVPMLLWVWPL
jgi:di/tricarboxylate transporter